MKPAPDDVPVNSSGAMTGGEAISVLEPRYRLLLPEVAQTCIVQVGVGGTGSWLAAALARIVYHTRQKGEAVKLILVDPDIVSEANVGRQYYAVCQSGEAKAASLAWRLNAALGLDITAVVAPFVAADFMPWLREQGLTSGYGRTRRLVLVGCVYNYAARRELAAAQQWQTPGPKEEGVWVVDAGNSFQSGQVLLGNLTDLAQLTVDGFGLCRGLPSPYLQEPGLLESDPVDASPPFNGALSCAELTWREEQSLLINTQVAAVAAQYVYDLVVRRALHQFATYLNLEPPTMRSLLLTLTNLDRFGLPV
jgi:PRTRC genetic system ThiF family protein